MRRKQITTATTTKHVYTSNNVKSSNKNNKIITMRTNSFSSFSLGAVGMFVDANEERKSKTHDKFILYSICKSFFYRRFYTNKLHRKSHLSDQPNNIFQAKKQGNIYQHTVEFTWIGCVWFASMCQMIQENSIKEWAIKGKKQKKQKLNKYRIAFHSNWFQCLLATYWMAPYYQLIPLIYFHYSNASIKFIAA